MKSEKMKWVYTFILLFLTILWAAFCVKTVKEAMAAPTAMTVLEVAGVGPLLGALITWCGDVKQFWFRKSTPVAPDISTSTSTTSTTSSGSGPPEPGS